MEKKCYLCPYPATETCSRWFVTLPSKQKTRCSRTVKEEKLFQVLCRLLFRGAPFSPQGLGQVLPIQVSSSIWPFVVWCGVSVSKAFHHLIDNFERFSIKKRKKTLDVNPGCVRQRGKETIWWLHVISKQARWSLCFAPLSKTLKYTKCGTGQKDNGLATLL